MLLKNVDTSKRQLDFGAKGVFHGKKVRSRVEAGGHPHGFVTVDDQEKAKAVADWIEKTALEQKVTTCAELVELLRKRST
jgi:hypothetical protein